jgi:4-amino-4-deoxy-L-arabinose transferase-like glycosyltransferase
VDDARAPVGSWHRKVLIGILIVGLLIRIAWGVTRPVDEATLALLPDQREYLELATNLLHDRVLGFRDERLNDEVRAFRMPGYPAFMALCGGEPRAIRLAQALLDTSTALAAYLLARRWLSARSALIAVTLVAFNPFLIYFSALLLSETLFTAMLAWAMVLLSVRGSPLERWRAGLTWVAGVGLLALSIHVRPSAIGLPLLLGVFAVLTNRDPHANFARRWPFPVGATALLLTLAAIAPWAFRNYHVVGEWIWTTTNSGFTAYDGFNPDATGASDQRFVATMPQLADMTEVERSRYLQERAREFISAHPGQALVLAGRKIARTWSPLPLSREFSSPLHVAVALIYSIPFDVLVLAGLWRTKGSVGAYDTTATIDNAHAAALPAGAKWLLLLPALYLTIIHALSVGSLRYRIPAEVPMAVIASSAVPIVCSRRTKRPGDEPMSPDDNARADAVQL